MSSQPVPTDTVRLSSPGLRVVKHDDQQLIDLREPAAQRYSAPNSTANRSGSAAQARGAEILLYPIRPVRPYLSARIAVRTLDLMVSITGLLLLWPLMVAVAIAVKVDSSGPVFYGSPRLGHRAPSFKAWKFRSMYPDADGHLARVLASNPEAAAEYETYHKLRNDPRLTRVGRFIRKTSLDELPQLFNIVIGQMSVVGPRPKLLNEGEMFGEALAVVLQVRPGLTGLWQVSGRNRLPVHDRILLDIDYARNRTLGGDLMICVRTFAQLWRPSRNGAY